MNMRILILLIIMNLILTSFLLWYIHQIINKLPNSLNRRHEDTIHNIRAGLNGIANRTDNNTKILNNIKELLEWPNEEV